MRITTETITPEKALSWLENNPSNRKLSRQHVDRLAATMLRGDWQQNGDPVRFNGDGRLLDGQHRLSAIVKSGVSVEAVVIRDLDADSFKTIDGGGKSRSIADVLSILKYKNTPLLAGALRIDMNYCSAGNAAQKTQWPIHQTLDHLNEQARDLPDLVNHYQSQWIPKMKGLMTPSEGAWLFWRYTKIDPESTIEFYRVIAGEAVDEVKSPPMMLRERLIEAKTTKRTLTQEERLAITIKALNAYIQNDDSMKQLRYRKFGPRAELFPKIPA